MSRPTVEQKTVERGIQRRTRTYEDGRVVVSHKIIYADANGKMISRTIKQPRPTVRGNVTTQGTVAYARAALAKAREEVRTGDHLVVKKTDSRLTFLQVARHWLKHCHHLKASTKQSHERTIEGSRLASLHDVTMGGLTHERLQEFQSTLTHFALSTQRQLLWIVKAVCDDAVDRGLLKANPCAKLKKPKVRKARPSMPSKQQVRDLLERLSSPTPPEGAADCWNLRQNVLEKQAGKSKIVDPRWRLLVETAAFTGLRAGELVGLKIEDLDAEVRTIDVVRSIPTNDRREDTPKSAAGVRTVRDIRPSLCLALAEVARGRQPNEFLFGWTDTDGVSRPYNHPNFYRRVFRPACDELGIGGRFHDLRHFHASLLIEARLDPVKVAARLGHERPSFTLDVYSHLFDQDTSGLGALLDAEWGQSNGKRGFAPSTAKPAPKKTSTNKPF